MVSWDQLVDSPGITLWISLWMVLYDLGGKRCTNAENLVAFQFEFFARLLCWK